MGWVASNPCAQALPRSSSLSRLLNNVFRLFGLHEMFKFKTRVAEGRYGFLEVVLTSPTCVDDRKKKTRRLPDLPAADI